MLSQSILIVALPLLRVAFAAPAPQYDYSSSDNTTDTAYGYSSTPDSGAYTSESSSSSTWATSSSASATWSTSTSMVESSSSVASATTTTTSSAAASTTTSTVHLVQVGQDGLTYTPNFVNAAINDTVVFQFHAKNHTVTQSAFKTPCTHLADASGAPIGLDSGFVPVAANATLLPSWSLVVDVTTPLWFYCRQTVPSSHCHAGMVFGINPPATGNTIEAFIALAESTATPPAQTWTETATLKWSGAGIVAQYSTGVSFAEAQAATTTGAPVATSTPGSASKRNVMGVSGVLAVAAGFALWA